MFKLFSILGEKDEQIASSNIRKRLMPEEVLSESELNLSNDLKNIIAEIKQLDVNFDLDRFITGAKSVYSIILSAYSKGEKNVLKELVDDRLFNLFSIDIDEKQNIQKNIVSINNVKVTSVSLNGNLAIISVEMETKQLINEKDMVLKEELSFIKHFGISSPIWRLSKIEQV